MKKINTCLIFFLFFAISQTNAQDKDYVPGNIMVKLNSATQVEDFCRDFQVYNKKSINLRTKRRLAQTINLWLLEYDFESVDEEALLRTVRNHKDVTIAQFNHTNVKLRSTPSDSNFSMQWSMNNTGASGADIDATEAWDITIGGTTVQGDDIVVAVIDDGFDINHEDLVQNLWKNTGEIPDNGTDDDGNGRVDDYDGWNAYNSNGVITSASHGTHVAGIIGARGNNEVGVTGVNWNVKIMPIQGSSSIESTVLEAYGYALDARTLYNNTNGMEGAFVVATNSSFGVDFEDPSNYPMWCGMYDLLGIEGVLNVVATANKDVDVDSAGDIPSTCTSFYMIAVTNTDNADNKYKNDSDPNDGAAWGATNIDIGAPGTSIISTFPGDTYATISGTSMATPHVAGAVALLYSAACDDFITYCKNNLSGGTLQIRDHILNGVDPIADLDPTGSTPTVTGGRLNVYNSLKSLTGYGSVDLSSLNGTNGFTINGIDTGDFSGSSVSSAGDINGDGFDDIIIGAPKADPNGNSNAGESYVILGNGAGSFTINGIDENDKSGSSVSSAGDINGDGFDDIIIGTNRLDLIGNLSPEESYVIFGKNTGFTSAFNLSSLNGTNGFIINGIDPDGGSGSSVSSAGDINGDGFDDIIIGAPRANPNGSPYSGNPYAGESYVIFGKNTGFTSAFNLSSLNGTNGFIINGIDPDGGLGSSVSSAGDINDDGFDDIIIGAVFASPNGVPYAGESYVIFGKNTGFSSSFNLSNLNGANGFIVNGMSFLSSLLVGSAGDVNGDGFDDIIIGASGANSNGNNRAGESYVIFGKNTGFTSPFSPGSLNGTNGFIVNGLEARAASGASVSSDGDINGDGFDDIIIGAPNETSTQDIEAGKSYIIFGKNTGFSGFINPDTLNGTNGFIINGIDIHDQAGGAVSSAGDVNGDGFDDIIIGAYLADPNGNSNAGESYVIFGGSGILPSGQTQWQCHQNCLITKHFDNEIIGTGTNVITNHSITTSGNVSTANGSNVSLKAKEYIELRTGFCIPASSNTELIIEGCQ